MKLLLFFCTIIFTIHTYSQSKSLLFQEGEYKVRQLVTPDFDGLSLERKVFAYYLSRAILTGRDIAWTQISREGISIRELFETLWKNRLEIPVDERNKIRDYMFKLYANHGNYDEVSNSKFVLQGIDPEVFFTLIDKLAPEKRDEARRLEKDIFDKNYRSKFISKDSGDLIADTNSNFYSKDMSLEKYESLSEADKLNFLSYPTVLADGSMGIETSKIGARFSKELTAIDYYFSLAQLYATPKENKMIEAYRKALRTGNPEDIHAADILWVQNKPSDIDFMINFVETYHDPLEIRGTWEGFLMLLTQDPNVKKRISNIQKNFEYFENAMPVRNEYKRKDFSQVPGAEGAYILFVGGESGERPFSGVNLPNFDFIRTQFGNKSFGAINVLTDINEESSKTLEHLRNWLPIEDHPNIEKFDYALYDSLEVEMHEILGHGSGVLKPGVKESDMGDLYAALEEMRAETAAMFHIMDPKIIEFGIIPEMSKAEFEIFRKFSVAMFFADYIKQYYRLEDNAQEITQAHRKAALTMMNFLIEKKALEIQLVEGEYPKVRVLNTDSARQALAELFGIIQTAKSEGNKKMAENLFDTFGRYTDFHKTMRAAVILKMKKDNVPRESISLNPRLRLIRDFKNRIEDVQIEYLQNSIKTVDDVVTYLSKDSEISFDLIYKSHSEIMRKTTCQGLFL